VSGAHSRDAIAMTQIIAHRGSSFVAPENTLAAVGLAWQEGADAVEVDVYMTADGRIVALHDDDLARTAGIDRKIDTLRLEELRDIDVGRWKDERFAGERVPTLSDLLRMTPPGRQVFVEIKCGTEVVDELVRVVRETRWPSSVVPIGFSLPLMQVVKQALPMCEVHGVFEFTDPDESGIRRPTTDELIAAAKQHKLDGVDLDAKGPLRPGMISALKSASLGVYVWTVDSPERARELIAAGVDGITTNRPGWLRKELGL
jgi:glycerophosphoryl diester phosphodiesterase